MKALVALLALVALVALRPTAVEAQDTVLVLAGREVAIWRPAGAAAVRHPLLVFSHGFGGCALQSRWLTAALAARGYWVLAPNHGDARCRLGGRRRSGAGPPRPAIPFRDAARWSDATYDDRAEDIRAVRRAAAEHPHLAGRLDAARVGLVGHSLGGYTVVGLAGGWRGWTPAGAPGVRAVLALSPYIDPFLHHGTLGGLAAPVMYQGGTRDPGVTPLVKRKGGAYDASPAPKYFVELEGAGHGAWGNLPDRSGWREPILAYAAAFLDHYVTGAPADPILTRAMPGVATLRWRSALGAGDTTTGLGTGGRTRGRRR